MTQIADSFKLVTRAYDVEGMKFVAKVTRGEKVYYQIHRFKEKKAPWEMPLLGTFKEVEDAIRSL